MSDNAIKAFLLPQRTFATEMAIDLTGCEAFPRLSELIQSLAGCRCHQHMHMIRNDDECVHGLTFSLEKHECIDHDLPHLGICHQAGTLALICHAFGMNPLATLK